MIAVIAGAVGLLAAGFAFARVRTAWSRTRPDGATRGRAKAVILLSIAGFPFATLMLAKLFNSDVLGWVFGLTLMAGVALLPCAAIFYAGMRLGSRGDGEGASNHDAEVWISVRVERGTVHASDDAPSKTLEISPHATLRRMLTLSMADNHVPTISGGKATWVIESSGASAGGVLRPIAVFAQQGAKIMWLSPRDVTVAAHFGETAPLLNFAYHRQDDPEALVATVQLTRS